ncbi:hypothetical protein NDU88_003966 [Pleurodeles waltl]|uniref:Uncharacterized protein n=1 Tax=Pleurodeles waltl TaxID=8319 RepID=A0AAV7RFQ5_PLEWA|nr:hypothetical protein NDU88_003966 [Pleurodeles waltl]
MCRGELRNSETPKVSSITPLSDQEESSKLLDLPKLPKRTKKEIMQHPDKTARNQLWIPEEEDLWKKGTKSRSHRSVRWGQEPLPTRLWLQELADGKMKTVRNAALAGEEFLEDAVHVPRQMDDCSPLVEWKSRQKALAKAEVMVKQKWSCWGLERSGRTQPMGES